MTLFKDMPIRKKLMRILFLISGVVLLVTCTTFFVYEFYTFRKTTEEKLSTIGKIIAANSTAALAFANQDDAKEILSALKTEPHIVAAGLYDADGKPFAQYLRGAGHDSLPSQPGRKGYYFSNGRLEGFQPVVLETRQLGFLYLRSNLSAMYERLRIYGIIVALVLALSGILAYILARILQRSVSKPILALAETASIVSSQKDYSVRVNKFGRDELGQLTDAFNEMLVQIENQTHALQEQQLREQVKIITTSLEAQEKERNLIGQELHDNVNQILVGAKLYLSMIRQDPEKNRALVLSAMDSIQMAIAENRQIAHALVAPDFEIKVLGDLVGDLAANMLERADLEVNINLEELDEGLLDEEQKLAAYRIFQEQCANIVKHARAKQVQITLATRNNLFEMSVSDDGVGMDHQPGNGIGLKNIRNRLSIFNGSVDVRTAPGEGFTLEIKIPLHALPAPRRSGTPGKPATSSNP